MENSSHALLHYICLTKKPTFFLREDEWWSCRGSGSEDLLERYQILHALEAQVVRGLSFAVDAPGRVSGWLIRKERRHLWRIVRLCFRKLYKSWFIGHPLLYPEVPQTSDLVDFGSQCDVYGLIHVHVHVVFLIIIRDDCWNSLSDDQTLQAGLKDMALFQNG